MCTCTAAGCEPRCEPHSLPWQSLYLQMTRKQKQLEASEARRAKKLAVRPRSARRPAGEADVQSRRYGRVAARPRSAATTYARPDNSLCGDHDEGHPRGSPISARRLRRPTRPMSARERRTVASAVPTRRPQSARPAKAGHRRPLSAGYSPAVAGSGRAGLSTPAPDQ